MSNRELWSKVFEIKKFDLNKDIHFITAKEIKQITGQEPRNMAKMDSTADLPSIFKNNGYFLLPIENGRYEIIRGEGYHKLEKNKKTGEYDADIKFSITTAARGASEMEYLDYSIYTGVLEKILGLGSMYPSIRGRGRSRSFNFFVNRHQVDVSGVQLEVDSGLEAEHAIVLIEAKMETPEDFIVRQLYYPYRHFGLISPYKKIVPTFFTYDLGNKVYKYWVYDFKNDVDYNSIYLKSVHAFKIISTEPVELSELKPLENTQIADIPQANDLDKIITMVFGVNEKIDDYKKIAKYFEFNERQSSYYRQAAESLGLISSHKGKYYLTDKGQKLIKLSTSERNIFFIKLISEYELVKSSLDILQHKSVLTDGDLVKLVRQNHKISGSTVIRRAQSLKSWLNWIAERTNTFIKEDNKFIVS
ncbi:MAG TPA: hypothetical protein VFX17_00570 [Patescibacteria group bacterium]|nr:hypothetical protein [Patescibacteria group bacterium]